MASTCNHCGGLIFPQHERSCPQCGKEIVMADCDLGSGGKVNSRADNQDKRLPLASRHFPGADGGTERTRTPVAGKPAGMGGGPGNVPVHITFGFLFLLIAATRYLIYFGPARELHSFNAAQAIGASLGYLFVWSFAYWFCATSPRKALVTWLGGAAVVLSTLIGSYVGFVFLFAIYFIRRHQRSTSGAT